MNSQDATYRYMASERGRDVLKALDDWEGYLAYIEDLRAKTPDQFTQTDIIINEGRAEAMRVFAVRTARRAAHWALQMENMK